MEKVEDVVIKRIPEHFNEVIMRYRKQLSESRAYYEQLMNMGDFMQMYMNRESLVEEEQGWERYMNRVERLHNYVETIREYLQQIREMYQTQIDIHQNRIMSILTIVTTLFLPLTLITGWYGMNAGISMEIWLSGSNRTVRSSYYYRDSIFQEKADLDIFERRNVMSASESTYLHD